MKRWSIATSLVLACIPTTLFACAILLGSYQLQDIKAGIFPGQENHAAAKDCGKFRMSEAEIRSFFTHSMDITPKDKEEKYRWIPCQVTGTITNGELVADFAIFASKIGQLKYPDGQVQWLACKKCGKAFF